jgi:hypothetical protein
MVQRRVSKQMRGRRLYITIAVLLIASAMVVLLWAFVRGG